MCVVENFFFVKSCTCYGELFAERSCVLCSVACCEGLCTVEGCVLCRFLHCGAM